MTDSGFIRNNAYVYNVEANQPHYSFSTRWCLGMVQCDQIYSWEKQEKSFIADYSLGERRMQ